MAIPNDVLLKLYKNLLAARLLGDKSYELVGQGLIRWTTGTHRPTGEEAIPVAVLANLKKGDYFRPSFRTHPIFFAQSDGAYSFRDIIAQELNRDIIKAGGHSYYLAPEVGNTGHSVCLGEDVNVMVGAALAATIKGTDQVAFTIFGDGQANRGPIHEAMVLAAAKKLPIIFGLQNNKYAVSTPWYTSYAIKDLADRAKAYGFPGITVDGNDIMATYEVVKEYVDRARSGGGSGLIVFDTWRLGGHTVQDAQPYRPKGEAQEWWKNDPLPRFQKKMMEMKLITEADVKKWTAEIKAELEEATKAAMAIPEMTYADHAKTAFDTL